MDGFNEKKWFVYLTDHHEGPFSLPEIQAKMSQSQVTVANYVWAEGLTDWKPMTEVAEFVSLLTPAPAMLAATGSSGSLSLPTLAIPEKSATSPEIQFAGFQVEESPAIVSEIEITGNAIKRSAVALTAAPAKKGNVQLVKKSNEGQKLTQAKPEKTDKTTKTEKTGKAQKPGTAEKTTETTAQPSKVRLVRIAAALLVPAGIAGAYFSGSLDGLLNTPAVKASTHAISDLTQPFLIKLADRVPMLAPWISPIPTLEDVSPEDYEVLKEAALQKIADGPKIAVAVSNGDVFAPTFYVSSNLPDGAVIDVYAEGIPDTLLNQLSFHGKAQAKIDKKLGKSGAVHFADGKPLPRGEYIVYATESPQQPDAIKALLAGIPAVTAKTAPVLPKNLKLLVSKPVFLGGNKDATYNSRLKDFHDKLRTKASGEIAEVKQFEATLESQLAQTSAKYEKLRGLVRNGKPSFAAHKAWAVFDAQWSKLEDGLKQSYLKWSDHALETEYFYGILYVLTKASGDAIDKLHQLHSDLFDGKINIKSFEIQRGSAVSLADTAVSTLKNKISQVESLAPTPNGMPRREGL